MTKIIAINHTLNLEKFYSTYFKNDDFKILDYKTRILALGYRTTDVDLIILDNRISIHDLNIFVANMKGKGLNIDNIIIPNVLLETESYTIYQKNPSKKFYNNIIPIIKREIIDNYELNPSKNIHKLGELELNEEYKIAYVKGKNLKLRQKEFDLLLYLVKNLDKPISKEELLQELWKDEDIPNNNTLNVHIHRIREILDIYDYKEYKILTMWKYGYKFSKNN